MISSTMDFDTEATLESQGQLLPDEVPFRILVLGNWSGDRGADFFENVPPRPIVIDRDNFDQVIEKLNVRVDLDLDRDGKETLSLMFKVLDDFHPDRIFERVPIFSELRNIRRGLLNESTFNEAAYQVRHLFEEGSERERFEISSQSVKSDSQIAEGGDLLDSILSKPTGDKSAKQSETPYSNELSKFVSKVVRSHIVHTDENEQARLLSLVDEASGELMRSILHHPRFQELEASWRGAYLLVRKVETDVDLKMYLLDVTKNELLSNLRSVSSLAESDVYKWMVRDTIEIPGADPWALVCGNFDFNINVDDAAALIRIAKVAEVANAPFVSHLSSEMFGVSFFNSSNSHSDWNVREDSGVKKLWETIRSIPEARFLGLVMPRFLARLPYGAETDPIDNFSFEEFKQISEHENYLWSNPSFVFALLLAQTFRKYGWEVSQGFQHSLFDFPTHIYQEEGETKTKPCAEILMTEAICQKLLEEGLMPLISIKNSDRVQLGRSQSVAYPLKALAGRWN